MLGSQNRCASLCRYIRWHFPRPFTQVGHSNEQVPDEEQRWARERLDSLFGVFGGFADSDREIVAIMKQAAAA